MTIEGQWESEAYDRGYAQAKADATTPDALWFELERQGLVTWESGIGGVRYRVEATTQERQHTLTDDCWCRPVVTVVG